MEKERVKKLTLDFNERQEEEEFQDQFQAVTFEHFPFSFLLIFNNKFNFSVDIQSLKSELVS